jgi:hypothetical protein
MRVFTSFKWHIVVFTTGLCKPNDEASDSITGYQLWKTIFFHQPVSYFAFVNAKAQFYKT